MSVLHTYIPQDRRRALVRGESLPDRTSGSALFADISGFTPLTAALVSRLGPRRGAEELTGRLNAVYDGLIQQVDRHGGSVIGFAGDAMTCWFAEQPAGGRPQATGGPGSLPPARCPSAVACALKMQRAMDAFPDLALKISIATGAARRFVVGDPGIQLLDTLAGVTLARMAEGEHLAGRGEILADAATLQATAGPVPVIEWRTGSQSGAVFGIIDQVAVPRSMLSAPAMDDRSPEPDDESLPDHALRPWLFPAVFEREQAGMGAFLTELRTAVALFVRFEGIDFDGDDAAGGQLDEFVRRAQEIVTGQGGALLDLTIGDKGNYCYAAFGAPVAHEDDARRALNGAMALRALGAELRFISGVQIGVSRGTMRTGAYGGATRRTYGVLGEEVNLAARLMQAAAPGQIVASSRVRDAACADFQFEALPPLKVKGKPLPITVFLLSGAARRKNYRLLDPSYTLPMVGREAELALVAERMEQARQGYGQVIGITAEAGMGKSRLVAEIIHLAQKRGFTGYGGACQSDGVNAPYLVWRGILGGFFDLDAGAPPETQAQWLKATLENLAPHRVQALPLVAGTMGLALPDNDFTHGLQPKDRKSALEAALVDCIRGAAEAARPDKRALLFVLEDVHWIDALSHDLLEAVGRDIANLPVLLVLAYRTPETARLAVPRLEALLHFTRIALAELSPGECAQLITAKVREVYPAHDAAPSPGVVERLAARAQGNPFYLEEFLNYLRDRNLDPGDAAALDRLELPDSLHTLILSRIDRLGEREKTVLKVASIIGRAFKVTWLHGYYPALGDQARLESDLENLRRLDITPLDRPGPGPAYVFKHIVTRQVAYESMPYAMRAGLHEQLAHYLEVACPDTPSPDLLAYHYGQSDCLPKKIEYLRKAGEAAQAAFANEAALDYYGRLLSLLTAAAERIELQLKRGAVLELTGQWQQAEACYADALALAPAQGRDAPVWAARCQFALGSLHRLRGEYDAALSWFEAARDVWAALGDRTRLGQTLTQLGVVHTDKGDYAAAHRYLDEGLALARAMDDRLGMAQALASQGILAWRHGDFAAARALYTESLALRRERDEKQAIADLQNNLGLVAYDQGDYPGAWALYAESLALRRAMGDKRGIGRAVLNLGTVASERGEPAAALALFEESVASLREIGDKHGLATALHGLGVVAYGQGNYAAGQACHQESLALRRAIGDKRGVTISLVALGDGALALGDYQAARACFAESLALGLEMDDKWIAAYALLGLGRVALVQAEVSAAGQSIVESLRLRRDIGDRRGMISSLVGLAGVALSRGDPARAARLGGAAESLLISLNANMEIEMRPVHEGTVTAARAAMGEAAFNAAHVEGWQMTLEEAVSYAVESTS